MISITGKYCSAKVFTDLVEATALVQLKTLCDQPFTAGCKVRVMPDVHAGAGCVIGFTANLGKRVIPNLVGVDIGCGMLVIPMGQKKISLQALDDACHCVPSGFSVWDKIQVEFDLSQLRCFYALQKVNRIDRSLGTLGGGNHFIELDKDDDGNQYLVIHTGSRNLGKQVAEIYQAQAIQACSPKQSFEKQAKDFVAFAKSTGNECEIASGLKMLRDTCEAAKIPDGLCYLEGHSYDNYLHDMRVCQDWATTNRNTIARIILEKMGLVGLGESFTTVHNYIDFDSGIIRKGAVSARAGETLIIPINMRDGSLICVGKGNDDWNCSAPHGAGRLMSRKEARSQVSLDAFRESMRGIYTTCINEGTLDESPMAYKPMDSILANIGDTVDVLSVVKPIYNFKAAGE